MYTDGRQLRQYRDLDLQRKVAALDHGNGQGPEFFNLLEVEDLHGASEVGTRACVTHASDVLFFTSARPDLLENVTYHPDRRDSSSLVGAVVLGRGIKKTR